MPRINVYLNQDLLERAQNELPELTNMSAVLARGLQAMLDEANPPAPEVVPFPHLHRMFSPRPNPNIHLLPAHSIDDAMAQVRQFRLHQSVAWRLVSVVVDRQNIGYYAVLEEVV